MQERIVGPLVGGLRLVLVVAAIGVALLPIGRSVVSGFCPPATAVGEATGATVLAMAATPATTVSAVVLAEASATDAGPTDVEPTDGAGTPTDGAPTGDPDAPTDGATGPAGEGSDAPDDGATSPGSDDADPCGEGVERCLPPLVSAIVSFGGGPCGEEALAIMRGSMLPAFLLSTVLLAGAWVLRPRHGHGVLSRF